MKNRLHFLLAVIFGLLWQLPGAAQEINPQVILETSLGKIRLEVFADKAPISAKNFLKYVDDKFYDGLVFHRIIGGFMIQGGGLDAGLKEKPGRGPLPTRRAMACPMPVARSLWRAPLSPTVPRRSFS